MNNSEAAAQLGRVKSPRKADAVRANGRLGGRPQVPIESIECTCGATGDVHKSNCKRSRTAYQRRYRAKLKPA